MISLRHDRPGWPDINVGPGWSDPDSRIHPSSRQPAIPHRHRVVEIVEFSVAGTYVEEGPSPSLVDGEDQEVRVCKDWGTAPGVLGGAEGAGGRTDEGEMGQAREKKKWIFLRGFSALAPM